MPTDDDYRHMAELARAETDDERFTRWRIAYGTTAAAFMEYGWQWGERCLHHDGLAALTFLTALVLTGGLATLALLPLAWIGGMR